MNNSKGGVSGLFLLFLVFLVLRLTDVVTWSWWWVTAPIWGPMALVVVITLFLCVCIAVAALVSARE